MNRAILSSTLVVTALAAACAGDGKAGTGTAPIVGDPSEQAESNADQPVENPNQPQGNANQPVDPESSPGPVPTGTSEPGPGPGPGGPTIDCGRVCEGFSAQCAELCTRTCEPYNGQEFPCRDELEDLVECILALCESGGTSADTCQEQNAALQTCAQTVEPPAQ